MNHQPLSSNLVALTYHLSDGAYHDGTALGKALGISRAAIWKAIQKLVAYGLPITATQGKGYRMTRPVTLLDAAKLTTAMKASGVAVSVLEKTPSTNEAVMGMHDTSTLFCLSETQTPGRGRFQRSWYSPFAQNLYLSLRYPYAGGLSELGGLGLVVTLAVCRGIEQALDLKPHQLGVKWPNDIVVDGAKLGGALLDVHAESHGACQVVVGVGVNVNMTAVPERAITQPWTSLARMTGGDVDRHALAVAVMQALLQDLESFSYQGFHGFRDAWEARDTLLGEPVTCLRGDHEHTGICQGVNDHGALLLQQPDGSTIALSSGDASKQRHKV